MNTQRRSLLRTGLACAVGGLSLATPSARAQSSYPSRPIRLVVGFAPGSGADLIARMFGQKLGERMGQAIVVENKAAAGGMVAAESVAQAAPDGYTLLFVTGAITTSAALNPNMRIDIQKDLAPVAMIGRSEVVLMVGPSMNTRNVADFVKDAKARPGVLNYGSSGVGGSTHFFTEQMAELMGIRLTHVPYKGAGPAAAALRGGEIHTMLATQSVAAPLVGGQMQALAITGTKRSSLLPSVPTFAEAGFPDFDASVFSGILAPAGLPPALIARINQDVNDTLKDPAIVRGLSTDSGLTLLGGTPAFFADEIGKSLTQMRKTAQQAGIKAS